MFQNIDKFLKRTTFVLELQKRNTMSKLKQLILSCSLLLAAQLGYPSVVNNDAQNNDGVSIIIIANVPCTGTDKSNYINASIDGHYLTVIFTESLGQVSIEVTTSTGVPMETLSMTTPNGQVLYIALPGDYIINFTLPNGDEYYGEFTVTD